eukprot:6194538-Pleurochrysis_carterae.AAC.4
MHACRVFTQQKHFDPAWVQVCFVILACAPCLCRAQTLAVLLKWLQHSPALRQPPAKVVEARFPDPAVSAESRALQAAKATAAAAAAAATTDGGGGGHGGGGGAYVYAAQLKTQEETILRLQRLLKASPTELAAQLGVAEEVRAQLELQLSRALAGAKARESELVGFRARSDEMAQSRGRLEAAEANVASQQRTIDGLNALLSSAPPEVQEMAAMVTLKGQLEVTVASYKGKLADMEAKVEALQRQLDAARQEDPFQARRGDGPNAPRCKHPLSPHHAHSNPLLGATARLLAISPSERTRLLLATPHHASPLSPHPTRKGISSQQGAADCVRGRCCAEGMGEAS